MKKIIFLLLIISMPANAYLTKLSDEFIIQTENALYLQQLDKTTCILKFVSLNKNKDRRRIQPFVEDDIVFKNTRCDDMVQIMKKNRLD